MQQNIKKSTLIMSIDFFINQKDKLKNIFLTAGKADQP